MNRESKIKARRTKLNKCSKEELVNKIIFKDKEVAKLVAKNTNLIGFAGKLESKLYDANKQHTDKMEYMRLKTDKLIKKNRRLETILTCMSVTLIVVTTLLVYLAL